MARVKKASIHDMGLENPDELTQSIAKGLEESKPNVDIPNGYIRVELCGNGKLTAPKVIHVKNFTADDILEMSTQTEDFLKETNLKILQKNIYESVDILEFSEPEIKHIFLTDNILLTYL